MEDEAPAVKRLTSLLKDTTPTVEILAALDSIEATVNWLKANESPEVIFMDIHLSDGNSFLIFEQVEVKCPVIFATAYDEYAVRAFKVNSIDYLLKPILKEDLARALGKFSSYAMQQRFPLQDLKVAIQSIKLARKEYKQRFLVRYSDRLIPLHVEKARYFCAEDKEVFLQTEDKKYAIDFTLDQLEELLDPKLFFRLNRKYIGQIVSIDKIFNHLNGKLKLILSPTTLEDVFVSRERASEFKAWLEA